MERSSNMKNTTLVAIEGEQAYQSKKWPDRNHPVAGWILIMDELIKDGKTNSVTQAGDRPSLEIVRKIAATAVTCMDQNGAIERSK